VFLLGEVDALEKIAFNYLSNALKFTPRGGTIELGIQTVGGAQPRVRIFVRDNGPGIREDDQAKLFKVFSQVDESTTREYEGTGLGLALVKSLAEEMNADAGVQSTVGEGSTFFVEFDAMGRPDDYEDTGQFAVREWLLAEAHNKTGEEDDKTVAGWDQSGQRILVVDDLADMRTLISGTLAGQGMQVMTAANGKQGFELAMLHRPDLIVTDWMMPVMAGPDLIRSVRDEPGLRSTPIVLLTAKSDEESKLTGTEIGADAFVGKPFNEQELVSCVGNLLALKSREREVEALNHRLTEQVLKRYLPPDLVEKIVHGDASLVQEPRSVTATILFSDLKGFTEFSSSVRAPKLARVLNEYLAAMTDVIFSHGGTIDKFVGDAIMVIFGAPTPLSSQDQADKAAHCALAMQRQMSTLQKGWREEGLPELSMRIGLHQGPVIVGNFGSEIRSDYTAVGPTVNLASRIESVCEPGGVYVSGEVCDFLPESMSEPVGNFELKGIDGKTRLYCLAK
jgi:class 3 adenylate cyclase